MDYVLVVMEVVERASQLQRHPFASAVPAEQALVGARRANIQRSTQVAPCGKESRETGGWGC